MVRVVRVTDSVVVVIMVMVINVVHDTVPDVLIFIVGEEIEVVSIQISEIRLLTKRFQVLPNIPSMVKDVLPVLPLQGYVSVVTFTFSDCTQILEESGSAVFLQTELVWRLSCFDNDFQFLKVTKDRKMDSQSPE